MSEKRFCPQCGTKNVSSDTDGFVKRWRNPGIWKCDECGYSGFMPVGDPDNYEFDTEVEPSGKYEFETLTRRDLSIILLVISLLLIIYSVLI